MAENDRQKNSVGNLWIPLGSAVIALGVISGAAVTWATDRAELKAATAAVTVHTTAIDSLRQESAARSERDANLKEQLKRMQEQLDRIADRVGAKP